jgi:MFS transporter, DHA2 family, multidrug resistance protein
MAAMATEATSAGPVAAGRPSHYPVLGAAAVLVGAFVVNFDTRLFSIALPDLRGAFGLSFDEGAWLSTVATGSQILVAPAIAWLATVFGVRRVLVVPSLIYTAASLGIPFIRNYQMLLIAHFIHGLLLGVFIPATIMIVLRNLPMRWWLPGLSIYAFRLAFISNTGVWLVGFYVQHLGWQWIYWQDAAVALVMAQLTWLGTPHEDVNRQLLAKADWGGMLLLGAALAMIYAGLDQGNRLDWFGSGAVTSLIAGGSVLFICFIINEAMVREPWASPTVLFSRNVILVLLTLVAYMVTSLSNTMLITNFLTTVGQFRPEQIGDMLAMYTALPLIVVIFVVVYLLRRIDARIVAIVGFVSFAIAAWLGTRVTQAWSPETFIPMALVQSVGQGLTFTALLIFATSNSNPARVTAFVAYIQFMRVDVIEISTSAMSTWLRVREQVHSHLIGLHVSVGDSEVAQVLARLTGRFAEHSAAVETAVAGATETLAALVRREANVLSIIDGFQVCFWAALVGLLLISLMRAAPPGPLTPGTRQAPPAGPPHPQATA